jgi:hypothetical protein
MIGLTVIQIDLDHPVHHDFGRGMLLERFLNHRLLVHSRATFSLSLPERPLQVVISYYHHFKHQQLCHRPPHHSGVP